VSRGWGMADEPTPATGISRRDVLKRGAIVGGVGAAAWVAPTITTLGPRAFAATGTEEPGAGPISWAMIWYVKDNQYWLVKYEYRDGSYASNCNAGPNNVSQNDVNCTNYFNAQQTKVAALTRGTGCPPGVTVTASTSGSLQIGVASGTAIHGWVLHDGTCRNVTRDPRPPACRSPENPVKDPSGVITGNAGPPASELPSTSGTFLWHKCM
jgi:hypothetical protein